MRGGGEESRGEDQAVFWGGDAVFEGPSGGMPEERRNERGIDTEIKEENEEARLGGKGRQQR